MAHGTCRWRGTRCTPRFTACRLTTSTTTPTARSAGSRQAPPTSTCTLSSRTSRPRRWATRYAIPRNTQGVLEGRGGGLPRVVVPLTTHLVRRWSADRAPVVPQVWKYFEQLMRRIRRPPNLGPPPEAKAPGADCGLMKRPRRSWPRPGHDTDVAVRRPPRLALCVGAASNRYRGGAFAHAAHRHHHAGPASPQLAVVGAVAPGRLGIPGHGQDSPDRGVPERQAVRARPVDHGHGRTGACSPVLPRARAHPWGAAARRRHR